LRLVTFPPLPPFPERKLPRFSRRIALATALLAPWLYFRRLDFFFAGMTFSCPLENLFREEVVPAHFSLRISSKYFLGKPSTTYQRPAAPDSKPMKRDTTGHTKDSFRRRPVIVLAIGL
jgi:hypothetical protein